MEKSAQSQSDFRLRKSIDLLLFAQNKLANRSITGLENLDAIHPEESVIIIVSHTTGFDIPLTVNALGARMDIAITEQSTHGKIAKEPFAYVGQKIAGSRNFLPISYSWRGEEKHADRFNPNDSVAMEKTLGFGRNVLVAVHKPLTINPDGNVVSPHAGYLAAYLAGKSNHRVLPVGVSYECAADTKYDALVAVGGPFDLIGEADVAIIDYLNTKRQSSGLSTEEETVMEYQLKRLRSDGGTLLEAVQSLQNLNEEYPVIDQMYTGQKKSTSGRSFPSVR
ncbi:hypothetical protein H7100_00455 [Candidatus Saccharibacteria bacterium]|nr:hypothetical protein [Candidatus Saccharibacteria bacterium]